MQHIVHLMTCRLGKYCKTTSVNNSLTLKVPEKLQLYGLYVHYVVHICDFGMLRVKKKETYHYRLFMDSTLHDSLFFSLKTSAQHSVNSRWTLKPA